MAVCSAREAAYHLETHFAHQQYEGYLALSNHTYKLFKQLGDRLLIGDLDQGAGQSQLIADIRNDIRALRHLTGLEIRLVGDREVEELDRLAKIERVLEALVAEYMLLADGTDPGAIRNDWTRVSDMLDTKIDRDFSSIIQEAILAEGEEVREVRDETSARIALFKVAAAAFAFIAVVAGGLSLVMLARDIRRPIGRARGRSPPARWIITSPPAAATNLTTSAARSTAWRIRSRRARWRWPRPRRGWSTRSRSGRRS